uniref:Uncharacterized protein n=1 Tax=Borely moumouvirus TaxID=2712067 RepID=A0A6G6ACN3_9VIRU
MNMNTISHNKMKKIYLDDMNNTYILDNRGILYLQFNNKLLPFIFIFKNIDKCFMIDKYTYVVYHDKTISIFNKYLLNINSLFKDLIIFDISDVQYYSNDQIIVILKDGQLLVNFDVSYLNKTYGTKFLNNPRTGNIPYTNIRMEKNLLFAQKNDMVDIFNITKEGDSYIRTVRLIPSMDLNIFNNTDFKSITTINNIYYMMKNLSCPFINNEIYKIRGYCLYNSVDFIVCYYDTDIFEEIIKPITLLIPQDKFQIVNYIGKKCIMTITFNPEDEMELQTNGDFYVLSYKKNFYKIDEKFSQILFDENLIDYGDFYIDKGDEVLSIDLNYQDSIFDQLLAIIPNIYRLNFENIYKFEQINDKGKIMSYGNGVTRHTFNILRQDIDIILKNKIDNLDNKTAFKLGQLIYFANTDGGEFFKNIHPYFFYLMSNEFDAEILLKKFKPENFELFMKQYTQYSKNPEMLIELGIENKNFLDYIFSSDLSEKHIEIYKYIAKGFKYFYKRNSNYKFLKKCRVPHLINILISPDNFEIKLKFIVMDDVDVQLFRKFKKNFTDIFSNLSSEKISKFSQNTTGSEYYFGEIYVIYDYKKPQTLEYQVFDEDTILQNTDEIIQPIESVNMPIIKDIKPEYFISTCNRELIIYVEPSKENIQKIIDYLTIDDYCLKN